MTTGYGLYGLPEPELPPRPPSKWRWPIRIIIALMVIVGVAVTLLSMVGGNSEKLRLLLEQQVHEGSGYTAQIGLLNAASFYPVLGIDLDDMVLSRKDSSGAVARFGHINFSSGFWGATIGLPSLRSFDFRDVTLDAGFLTPQAFQIDRFYIDVAQPAAPALRLKGSYDGKPVAMNIALRQKTNFLGAASYEIADHAVWSLRAGDMLFNGTMKKGVLRQRIVVIDSFVTHRGAQPLTGEIALLRGYGDVNYAGYFKSASSPLEFDLTSGRVNGVREIHGTVQSDGFDVQDYASLRRAYDDVLDFYRGDQKKVPPQPVDLTAFKMDVNAAFKGLKNGSAMIGDLVFPARIDNGFLRLSPLNGTADGAALSGDVVLDATKIPARLDVSLRFDAPDAAVRPPALSMLWDGALVAHFPGKDLHLECVRGFFEIENGMAVTDNLFFGTRQVELYARGKLGDPVGGLDLKLIPNDSGLKNLQLKGTFESPAIRSVAASNDNVVFIPCGNKK